MKQTNFLNVLDSKQTTVTVVPKTTEPSPAELKLQELLNRKEILDIEMGNCPICDGRSRGVCGQNHKSEWRDLLKEIDEAELNARGK
jgi:hypothetical protein